MESGGSWERRLGLCGEKIKNREVSGFERAGKQNAGFVVVW